MNRREQRRDRGAVAVWGWSQYFIAMGAIPLCGRPMVAQQSTVAVHVTADATRGVQDILARHITVRLTRVSVKQAIDTVSRIANVPIEFQRSMLDAYTTPVTLNATDVPLGVVLEQVLDGTALRVVGSRRRTLIVVGAQGGPVDSVPASGVVLGRVIDSTTGKGITGATVKVAGTKLTVMVRDSGRFTMKNVPAGDMVLTVRAFGYRPVERSVTVAEGNPVMVRISLVPAPNVLSGVVTTATGMQRKIEVGNDITTINVDSVMHVAPISSVTDLLETRVPGLTVVHSSGVPGDPSRLRLRGAGSIELNNDPIVIVDGTRVYGSQSDQRNQNLALSINNKTVNDQGLSAGAYNAPSPLDQIDPSSIETIEVLKGPSASAIYGSDAAGGVVVITTKHGRAGPTHWSIDAEQGVNWLPGKWPTNYYRFGVDTLAPANFVNNGVFCPWYIVGCVVDSVVPFQALNDPRYTILAHGSVQQTSLTVSGGVPMLTYNLTGGTQTTLGYLKLPGSEVQRYDSLYGPIPHSLVRPDRYNTWSVTGSLTATPQPTLTTTLQSSLFNGTQQRSALESAILQLSGEYLSPTLLTGPLLYGEFERVTDDALTSNNALSVQWRPWSWLPITATGGINTDQRTDVSYVPFGVFDDICTQPQAGLCRDTTGSYGLGRGTSRVTTLSAGTQMPAFRNKIMTSVGGNFYSTSTADFQDYTNQLAPGVSAPTTFTTNRCTSGASLCNSASGQSTSSQSTYGWYVEPRFNVASRFFAAPGFRLDGGSGGAKSSGLAGLSSFPKMDLSYVAVDRQDGHPLGGVLSLLRPRLSLGIAGRQPGPADKLRLYNVGFYRLSPPGVQGSLTSSGSCAPLVTLDGVTQTPAVCINALGNTALRPERSSELEGGFDATLWQNRLSISYSSYNKTTRDEIILVPVAQSVFSGSDQPISIQQNIGVVRNTGTEVTVTAIPVQSHAVSWTLGGNFSRNDNVVVRLNKGQLPIVMSGATGSTSAFQTRIQPGYPLFAEFVRPILGYADANQDGVIEPSEVRYGDSLVYAGQPDPKYQLNLTNDVSLFGGRLSVHTNMAYTSGLTQYNEGLCKGKGALDLVPNTPNTPLATQAAVIAAGCGNEGAVGSEIGLIQTVSTFRFQSLSVNYVLPTQVAHWAHVPRMIVALQGSNLGLHTNYRGKDPDVNAFATVSAGDQTRDTGQIPEPRTWLLHITLGN